MPETIEKLIQILSLVTPPVTCVWAWWLWVRRRKLDCFPMWRRAVSGVGLAFLTASIGLGGFSWVSYGYFNPEPDPSWLESLAGFAGFGLAISSVSLSVFANSWLRVALLCSSLSLLGFYYLLFLSP